jgi:23S rRNA pseudouridine955/2504/2580 synthase
MKEFTTGRNDAGQRLDRFLTKQGLPVSVIRKALRKKDIKINGKRGQADYRLVEGDVIRVYLRIQPAEKPQDKYYGVSANINIVYEDDNIILLDKPVGLTCHDDRNSLIERVKAYLYRKGEFEPANEQSFEPALCNRIDRNTAGIVIAAKNAESLRVMNEKIKLRQVTKLYLCILTAVPDKREATLTAFLEKHEDKNRVTVSNRKTESNKTIVTKYRVLDTRGSLALAEINLLTGRTHQIRAHMAWHGCPLLGDGKYGRNRVNKQYGFDKQALCSYKLVFDFGKTENTHLDYLTGKSFEVGSVWFLERYYSQDDSES